MLCYVHVTRTSCASTCVLEKKHEKRKFCVIKFIVSYAFIVCIRVTINARPHNVVSNYIPTISATIISS